MGDGVQAAKAGILEIGDVFVVNKADREGAQPLVRDLRTMVGLAERAAGDWRPPVLTTVASEGTGVAERLGALDRFREHQAATGADAARRLGRARREVEALALAGLRQRLRAEQGPALDALGRGVRDGDLDPYAAAEQLLRRLAR
jgi:LAO/AO transport system kinase